MGKTKTLLIGCGGSGIKTLMRLNGLLACKADFREDMRECIYYLVLDTDQHDLNIFTSTIESQMGGDEANMPFMMPVSLTDGYPRVRDMLSPSFNLKEGEISDLLKNYWWYNKDNSPFRGVHIHDPRTGAAQCCQVSYLAAWNYLAELEKAIPMLLTEIKKRNQGDNPLQDLKVFIVAGLSGGTGRGSWPLIAFKIRQYLLQIGKTIPIDGIFFDATCYPQITNPEQKQKMFVNSLTGMSELSAWVRLKDGLCPVKAKPPFPLPFSLPSLKNPKTDHSNDVIKFNPNDCIDNHFPATVDRAYVVFGENGSEAPLANNDQYHNMAASALYAQLVYARDIGSWSVNETYDIASFASTTFEVDFVSIQTYLQTEVRKAFLKKQSTLKDDVTEQEAIRYVNGEGDSTGFHNPGEKSFLKANNLWIPEKLTFNTHTNLLSAKTSLLCRMMTLLGEHFPELQPDESTKTMPVTSAFREKLSKQNLQEALDYVQDLCLADISDAKVNEIFNLILKQANLDGDLDESLRTLVMEQFSPKDKPISLQRALSFTNTLKDAFSSYHGTLTKKITVDFGDPQKDTFSDLETLLNKFVPYISERFGKKGLEHLNPRAKKFNETEIEDLCDKFAYIAHAAVFFRIKDTLVNFFKQAAEKLSGINLKLNMMTKFFAESRQQLGKELADEFSILLRKQINDDEILFDEFFADHTKKDAIQKAIPEAGTLKNLFYRQLKPILSRDELDALLTAVDKETGKPKAFTISQEKIMDCVETELRKLLENQYRTANEASRKIPANICDSVRKHVWLQQGFMEDNFSFDAVLRRNIEKWNELMSVTDRKGKLQDQFKDFLGLRTDQDEYMENPVNGKKEVIDEDTVKKTMVRSLVKVCKPWIRLENQTNRPNYCLVVLPFEIDDKEKGDMVKKIKEEFNLSASDSSWVPDILSPGQNRENKSIPLNRILVYTSDFLGFKDKIDGAALENILSLEYWESHRDQLELAENPDGSSLFEFDAETSGAWQEKAGALGFMAPFFVKEPFRKLRWHPWLKEETRDQGKEQLESVYKALFYAFLGHNIEKDPAILAAVQPYGWDKPLLEMGKDKKENFTFCHKQLEWKDGKMTEMRGSAWKSGVLATSIDQVVEFLNGQGRRDLRANGGPALEKSREEGTAIRCAILQEAEVFFHNVAESHIGPDQFRKIVDKCCDWIAEKGESSRDSSDKKYWKALSEYAENELKKLG